MVAIGECGLDYDRLHFCSPEIQKKYVPAPKISSLLDFLLNFLFLFLFNVTEAPPKPYAIFHLIFLDFDFDTYHVFSFLLLEIRYFEKQFELAYAMKLPMFLHMRAAAEDFCSILEQNKHR